MTERIFLLIMCFSSALFGEIRYEVQDLGRGNTPIINNTGWICFERDGHTMGITPQGKFLDIHHFKGFSKLSQRLLESTFPLDINDKGQMLVEGDFDDHGEKNFFIVDLNKRTFDVLVSNWKWTPKHPPIPRKINNKGQILDETGGVWNSNKKHKSFRNLLPKGVISETMNFNDSGKVVGLIIIPGTSVFPFKSDMAQLFTWSPSQGLNTFATPNYTDIHPTAINNLDQVAGSFAKEGWYPFVFDNNRGLRVLEYLEGQDVEAVIHDLNDVGEIVGSCEVFINNLTTDHATLWNFNTGKVVDLNDCVTLPQEWEYLSEAYRINEEGKIVGEGCVKSEDASHVFLLTPVK